ncbi:class I SAM-dependent RNA methyltransferase [Virgisporangium ochraceum]|uniref:23S rRNA methyltransferase n=1 Tax=Virgisporangium ochraceum TaxID=65505 RepID=A0A8J3ZSU2_9ACTN|nr:class I SAM-dependent RNA methyltransferase [Virgisporangium ochraceum]GIJ69542.1 23S rRNA methyltransferase [Virgisporangium ochraceum]
MEVTVGPVAHGGHCVARPDDGPVLFVRHALPGERVRVAVTERKAGFWRADAVEILEPSPDRVEPPCPFARPGVCGGCDFQHASSEAQRELKAAVVREQLARLARRPDVEVRVDALRGDLPGAASRGTAPRWRSRVQYAVGRDGRLGFHPFRSHRVVPVDDCPIALPAALGVLADRWSPDLASVEVVASSEGDVSVLTRRSRTGRARVVDGPATVREALGDRVFEVDADAFWQVHPSAPAVLVATVLDLLAPQPGERAWDLYSGAGLFASALADVVDRVTAVEGDARGVAAARRSLADQPNVHLVEGDVRKVLAGQPLRWVDVVVLDPPRSGAGRAVVEEVARRRPRAVAYVACDPAAFARDVATFAEHGYDLAELRAFDAFPMTHHVECVGLFTRS